MRKLILSIFCIGLAGCGGSSNSSTSQSINPDTAHDQKNNDNKDNGGSNERPKMVFGEGKLNESTLG
ncbi:hypothetical protein HG263_04650 [Pseudoalteromonas sp. JBTF-M23]|uniref:Lipoprotein n=1 Tax=Pseudoalteromonas caenipelagi TaxID=2726988 RepID=A0A849VB45_9GAMM|nr:hypothetical protein [Pseudoalteromonas caenipelagi]NOU49823.1 hypothetical protein [Pseudoalteromonas caenipelagi]